jgi:sulfatase maturation enzyme AslB (radical SAM superfamily)
MKIKPIFKYFPFFFLATFLLSKNKLQGVSIDTTYKCNLNCKHCYFKNQGFSQELSKEKWIKLLKEVKEKGVFWAAWVGGEPLLRQDLIKECKNFFTFNWIITNGTIPLPDWKDVFFFVSIDGPEEIHDQIRGIRGTYQKARKNILEHPELNIYLGTVLNSLNYQYIEEIVEKWKDTPIKGINFDFYTPLEAKDPLWLGWTERDKTIEKLKEIKRKYGSFILLSDEILELLKSKNAPRVTKNCLIKKMIICLDPLGKRKFPCVMEGVDCNRCGCIVSFITYAVFQNHDIESIKLLYKLLI